MKFKKVIHNFIFSVQHGFRFGLKGNRFLNLIALSTYKYQIPVIASFSYCKITYQLYTGYL